MLLVINLTNKMGFSQSKSLAKGFTKSEKIEEIKKHYYSSQISKLSPIQADPKAKQQASIITFSIPPRTATSNEKVILRLFVYRHGEVTLRQHTITDKIIKEHMSD